MFGGGVPFYVSTFWLATSLLHLDCLSVSYLIGWRKMGGHLEEFWQRVLAWVCGVCGGLCRNNGGTNNEKSWVVCLRSQIVEFNSCFFSNQCCCDVVCLLWFVWFSQDFARTNLFVFICLVVYLLVDWLYICWLFICLDVCLVVLSPCVCFFYFVWLFCLPSVGLLFI